MLGEILTTFIMIVTCHEENWSWRIGECIINEANRAGAGFPFVDYGDKVNHKRVVREAYYWFKDNVPAPCIVHWDEDGDFFVACPRWYVEEYGKEYY